MENEVKVIILAAGKGKRLQSDKANLPKVLREVDGKPLIKYVLDMLKRIDTVSFGDVIIVRGFLGEKVEQVCSSGYKYVWQHEQKGTGHAVMMAKEYYSEVDDDFLVLMGDMPFVKKNSIDGLCKFHRENGNDLSVLTARMPLPSSFGRIVRSPDGNIERIVEVKDADEVQLGIDETNTGIAVYSSRVLRLIDKLGNNNKQNEYYLTDLVTLSLEEGLKVGTYVNKDKESNEMEFIGINTMVDLVKASEYLNGKEL